MDDFDDTRELFAEVLMRAGHHSVMANSGRDALARLQYLQPDVIVSDLDMPELSGPEMIRELRSDARFKEIPIIIVSGAEKARAREQLGELADHVLAILRKPVTLDELLTTVARAVERAAT